MTCVIPIIIVAFRNPRDVTLCLQTLSALAPVPAASIHICENGGNSAFDALISDLTGPDGPCYRDGGAVSPPAQMDRVEQLWLARSNATPISIKIGQARENLGYAGAVNAWLTALKSGDWPGAWILNPDTQPEPSALAELVAEAERTGAGLIGSRQVSSQSPGVAMSCGLRWRKWRAATGNIASQDAAFVRQVIDAPSGASVYATRACIDRIGLMDDRYFLYFEDLEWGLRAKPLFGVGYAERSVVVHDFGTTIGSASSRRLVSPLSVFLDFRNRILFVRNNFPGWVGWTWLVGMAEAVIFVKLGAWKNAWAALSGLTAGIRGQSGIPLHMLEKHRAPENQTNYFLESALKRRVKLAISLGYFFVMTGFRRMARLFGRRPPVELCVLCYHGVRAHQQLDFTRQMQALRRWRQVVPAGWQGGPAPQTDLPPVALTFDDAFISLYQYALPTLKALDLPCTIFTPTAYLGGAPLWRMETSVDRGEKVMTGEQIAQIAGPLVTIGSHSVTHPHFTTLTPAAARRELEQSRLDLEALTGGPVSQFAFPYGDHNADLIELCRSCGYTHAFTIEPVPVRPRDQGFARGRIVVHPEDGMLTFYLKVHGAYAWMASVGALRRLLRKRMRPRAKPWYLNEAHRP